MHCPQAGRLHSSQVVVVRLQALISQLTLLRSTPAECDANVIAVALCEPTAGV